MASGAIYPPATWDYPTGYPHDDHHPDYAPYTSARSLQQYPQHPHAHLVWTPPSRLSYDSYQNSPYMRPSPVPSTHASPPSLRHSLEDDLAFAPDPNINPDNWFVQRDMLSPTHFPTRSHSSSDLPPGFVPQSGPIPNGRSHSYHESIREQPSVPQSYYFVPPSARSSSSASDDSVSGSSALRVPSVPRSRARSSDQVYDFPAHSSSVVDVPTTIPDEAQSRPRNTKSRPKRRSAHAAEPASDHPEVPGIVVSSVEHIAAHEDQAFRNVTSSSVPAPPPTAPSERSTESRTRTSSRVNPADLDSIDELDETNPYGVNLHHKGPYEAVAAILDETNPIASPVLRMKGIQQQVSAGSPLRPSRKIQSEPNANPMALNLKPGQILQSSIYQPMRPPHERALATYPPDQYTHPLHAPTDVSRVDYDAASVVSPLRRNQTLPVTSSARGPHDQYHHIPHHVGSEEADQAYRRLYPVDPSIYQPPPNSAHQHQMPRYTSEAPPNPMPSHPSQRTGFDHAARRRASHIDPIHNIQPSSEPASTTSVFPPEPPPTPDIDLRLSRTLYLTNPDQNQYPPSTRSRASPLPSAPEVIYPSPEPHPEQPTRSRANSGQPPRAPAPTEGSRRSSPRSSPPAPSPSTSPRQEMPRQEKSRRYEPPSQTLAAMRVPVPGHSSSVTSGSSSRTSSSLAPRHVPKRLVMPTPLATTTETSRRPNSGSDPRRPPQLLRRRSVPGAMLPRQHPSKPPQTANRGVLAFFGLGKGSKPTVHVRVTEPAKHVMNEKQHLRVREHQEPRKLSKRK